MKKSNSFFSIFVLSNLLLLTACTNETVQNNDIQSRKFDLNTIDFPANTTNAFDFVGKMHNEILYAYYLIPGQPSDIAGIYARIDSIATNRLGLQNLGATSYRLPDFEKIDYIVTTEITSATDVISNSDLSPSAKMSLSNFVSAISAFSTSDDTYEVIYQFIIDYEAAVMADPDFDAQDRELILTVSSVARYSMYANRKRPKKNTDPDWDILVSNIIASVEGAGAGPDDAFVYGLVAGIIANP